MHGCQSLGRCQELFYYLFYGGLVHKYIATCTVYIYIFVTTTTKNHHHILKGCTFTTCLSYISDNGAYVRSVVIPVAVTVVAVLLITMAFIVAIVSSLMCSRWVTLLHGIDAYNLACIFVMISSSFNTYTSEGCRQNTIWGRGQVIVFCWKPEEVVITNLYSFATAAGQTLHY